MGERSGVFTFVLCLFAATAAAHAPLALAPAEAALRGVGHDETAVDQAYVERRFAEAEAAVWFPAMQRLRWFEAESTTTAAMPHAVTLGEFAAGVERDFPRFRDEAHGAYLMKLPRAGGFAATTVATPLPPAPNAALFTESFESGMGNWTVENNTLDLYAWGATTCAAHSGSRSADPLRGGVNTLGCNDAYAPNLTSRMTHKSCEALQGAAQAWLDTYILMTTEVANDTLAFYYADGSGNLYGYGFSGTWSSWFRMVFNLKQWYRIGDVTALSCPKVVVEFETNGDTQSGYGARVDDLTVSTAAPSFLSAGMTATPSSGAAPLAVTFTSTVTGASASAEYLWSFGDAAGTTATTKNASFTYATAGDYSVRLRVTDSSSRAYAHGTIHVSAATPCSVTCTATVPATAKAGTPAAFKSTATATGCSGSVSYAWQFGDSQSSSQQNPSHSYTNAGTFTWKLTATAGASSCSKSGSIVVSPAGTTTAVRRRAVGRPPDSSTIATQAIGASGGTLSGGGVTLTVPSGAFGSTTTLKLTRSNDARGPSDLSSKFAVQGLPATLSADLTLAVDLDAAPSLVSGESVSVSIGALALDRDLAVSSVPFFLPATVSGKRVTATVPKGWSSATLAAAAVAPGDAAPLAYTGEFRHEMKVVKSKPVGNDHFTIYAGSSDTAWAQSALTTLESAFQRLNGLGFSWGCRQPQGGAFVKIPVYVSSLGTGETDPYGEQNSRLDPCGTGWIFTDYIALNKDFSVSSPTMRASIAHELFHFLQEMYVATSLTNPSRGLWIAEASSTWFETIFVSGSCPGVMTGSYQYPWKGLFNPTASAVEGSGRRKIQNHGYGAASLLKYHSDASSSQNDPFVASLWNALKGGGTDVDAFQNAVGSSIPDYWTRYARDYYTGQAGCATYQQSSEKAALKDAASLMQTFRFSAYPLSAISFLFDAQKLEITTKTPLPITAQGLNEGQTVYLYDVKNKTELGQITKAASTFTIEDITAYKGSVIVMTFVDANLPVTTGSTNEVTLTTGNTYKCYAVYFVSTYKEPASGNGWVTCTGNCRAYDGAVSENFVGDLKGDTYEALKMYCLPSPYYCRWTDPIFASVDNRLAFKLTNKGATMENFDLRLSWVLSAGGSRTQTVKVSAPIPRLSATVNAFQYKLTGGNVCGSVTMTGGIYDIVCDGSSYFLVSCEAYSGPSY